MTGNALGSNPNIGLFIKINVKCVVTLKLETIKSIKLNKSHGVELTEEAKQDSNVLDRFSSGQDIPIYYLKTVMNSRAEMAYINTYEDGTTITLISTKYSEYEEYILNILHKEDYNSYTGFSSEDDSEVSITLPVQIKKSTVDKISSLLEENEVFVVLNYYEGEQDLDKYLSAIMLGYTNQNPNKAEAMNVFNSSKLSTSQKITGVTDHSYYCADENYSDKDSSR